MEFKVPTSKAEMDELKKSLVQEIDDDELDLVAGGNDGLKLKFDEPMPWTCPFCGASLMLKSAQDGPKHVTQSCPKNPYK